MEKKSYPEFRLDSFSLVNFILRYWKVYLFTGIMAFIISAIISLLITPKFSSEVILYPSASVSGQATALFNNLASTEVTFGDEEAVEKILQILQSDDIKDKLIKKYNLFDHYEIEEDARYRHTILDKMLDRNLNFNKTRFMSVRIAVLDKDPVIAAAMANDIAFMIDSTFNSLIKEAGAKYVTVLEKQYSRQAELIRQYEDSLRQYRERLNSFNAGGSHGESRTDDMAEYGPDFVRCSENHEHAIEDLGSIRQKLTEARVAAGEDFPYTLIVNEARVSEKKAFPRRSVIVILSTLSTLLFVLLVLILIEGLSVKKN